MYKVIDNVKILMTAEELAELEAMGQAQPPISPTEAERLSALAEDLPRLTNEGAALTQALFDCYRELVELRRAGRYAEAVELMRGAVEAESNGVSSNGGPAKPQGFVGGGGRTERSGHPAGSRMKQSGVSSDDE